MFKCMNTGHHLFMTHKLMFLKDTLKSPPSENGTMKKASIYGIGLTTLFYISLGCLGYATFGNDTPGNILTGFRKPIWLIDIANLAVLVHLFGAYQVRVYNKFLLMLLQMDKDSNDR